MGYGLLLSIIEQLGYVALFLVLCLGLIGLPIPNEAVVMTGGALAFSGVLSPIPAFIMTCLGICSAMTFSYSIGRFAGARLADWFRKRKNIGSFIDRSEELSHRFGGYAIGISLCLPFVRHVTPYVMGMNKMKFGRFALFAYPSAFIWTMIYFVIGGFVGDQVEHLSAVIYRYGVWILGVLGVVAAGYIVYRIQKKSRVNSDKPSSIDSPL